jgi:transcriptional regulator with XRE-family HTH domain
VDEKAIIKKIKRLRKNQNMTLKELAERINLTESYLSRIETSNSAPPIHTLYLIAEALNTDIPYLFQEEPEDAVNNPSIIVVKNEDIESEKYTFGPFHRKTFRYTYIPLAKKKQGKNMQPYIVVEDFEFGETLTHDGEEFVYILDGSIELLYGTEMFLLNKGDYAYFDSRIPHNARSIGEKKSRTLVVIYPYKQLS